MHYIYMFSLYLLSVIIRLKDVADSDGASINPAAGRMQHEAEQALVLLMRCTHHHTGQRELWRKKEKQGVCEIENSLTLQYIIRN